MKRNRLFVARALEVEGFRFSGWPPRPIFSFYGLDGRLQHRSRSAKFDLTDSLCMYTGVATGMVTFGMCSQSAVARSWTHAELARQEENIRYDLSFDALQVDITRIKGLGLKSSEEALWELHVSMML